MKKFFAVFLLSVLLLSVGAEAEIEKSPYLDAAFSCLEKGNPFVERYNTLTSSDVRPLADMGIPYYFGGQNPDYLLTVRKLNESSSYGKKGDRYIYGMDCTGFIRYIQRACGEKECPKLSDMILKWGQYQDYRMDYIDDITDFAQVSKELRIGDFLVTKYGGRHILMFIGTLRDYGYTEETAAEMKDLLDYPLMINCGTDPNYVERTKKYIEENHLNAKPNKGGVTVSVVGPTWEDAPHQREDSVKEFYYYDLNGYQLSVYDLPHCTSHVWWRTVEADKGIN